MPSRDLIPFDTADPLRRQMKESVKANAAFRDYAMMGTGRSLRGLYGRYIKRAANDAQADLPPTTKLKTIETWSIRFSWVARVAQFDEIEKERRIETWRLRRLQVDEDDWARGEELRNLVSLSLETAPKLVKRTERVGKLPDGTQGKIITLGLNARDVATLTKLAMDMQRLATGAETERIQHTGAGGGDIIIRVVRGEDDE